MCCGEKRSALKLDGNPNSTPIMLLYYGDASMQIRGSATGHLYQFSRPHPVQTVDPRDATQMMQSRLFRQIPCR